MALSHVLIANRGEFAVRLIRAATDLGLRTTAVYSSDDAASLHVREADAAVALGRAGAAASLDGAALIDIARRSGCDAVHPGYGFLSENAEFAAAVAGAGIAFVGPPADRQRLLGENPRAQKPAREAGVPIADGTVDPLTDLDEARAAAKRVGYPV